MELGHGRQPHVPGVGPQPAAARAARLRRSRSPAITDRWLAPDSVGSLENPSWGQVDLRAQYNRPIAATGAVEFFVDIFNVMNSQASIRNQDLVAGSGGNAFGEPILWVEPAPRVPRRAREVLGA